MYLDFLFSDSHFVHRKATLKSSCVYLIIVFSSKVAKMRLRKVKINCGIFWLSSVLNGWHLYSCSLQGVPRYSSAYKIIMIDPERFFSFILQKLTDLFYPHRMIDDWKDFFKVGPRSSIRMESFAREAVCAWEASAWFCSSRGLDNCIGDCGREQYISLLLIW